MKRLSITILSFVLSVLTYSPDLYRSLPLTIDHRADQGISHFDPSSKVHSSFVLNSEQSTSPFPSCQPDLSSTPYLANNPTPSSNPESSINHGPASLRELAQAKGLFIGAAVSPSNLSKPEYASLLSGEFNALVPENAMKWEIIHPEPERFDFEPGDAIVEFAQKHGMRVMGHTLVWELQQPAWLTEGKHTRNEWINILCTHIKTVVGHYRGHIYAWQVVNEAINNDGTLRDTLWLRTIGPEYIAMAFQWASEADPQALLIYNDHSAEALNRKSQAIYTLVRGMQESGIPIHGVGMQMHIWLYGPPTPQDLAENMARFAKLGLQVHITEMDVRLQYSKLSISSKLFLQAQIYRQVVSVCLAAPNCDVFLTWGLSDRYSWIPWYTGNPDAPLLFDQDGRPKPAYYAIQEVLENP